LANESPIGVGSGGAALITAGIAIDFDMNDPFGGEGLHALMKGLTSSLSVGVGFENDFVEHVNGFVKALHEEHAHGIDVEIDRPDKRRIGLEFDGSQMDGAIKGIVDAMAAGSGESGFKFLAVRVGIELSSGGGKLDGRNVAALRRGELESSPGRGSLCLVIELKEVIAALRRAQEESTALAITEGGTESLRPNRRAHGSELIENDEIETIPAKRIGTVSTTERDSGTGSEKDSELLFGGAALPKGPR
jgi:hypothetical protein